MHTSKMFTKVAGIVLFAALAGCAGTNANVAATEGAAAAAGATATPSLGLSDTLVQVAVQAAKGWLSNKLGSAQGAVATAEDKAAAAQVGVDAAAAKAQQDGTAVTDQQKSGLLGLVKGLL